VPGHTAAHRLFLHHYDTLSIEHGFAHFDNPPVQNHSTESIDDWRKTPVDLAFLRQWKLPLEKAFVNAEGAALSLNTTAYTWFDYIRDHLGYRLQLATAAFPTTIVLNASWVFEATLINWGFAAPVNRRPVLLTLIDVDGFMVWNYSIPGADASMWQPTAALDPLRQRTTHVLATTVPEGCLGSLKAGGEYQLGLYMPDARAESLGYSSSYSIHLANDPRDVQWWVGPSSPFGPTGGVNIIGKVNVSDVAINNL
jgi:hypothetical protein